MGSILPFGKMFIMKDYRLLKLGDRLEFNQIVLHDLILRLNIFIKQTRPDFKPNLFWKEVYLAFAILFLSLS